MDHKSYNWQLIEFIDNGTAEGVPYVDCVPSSWLMYNQAAKKLLCFYPPPPYTDKLCKNLQKQIKQRNCPVDNWPLWHVNIRGGAGIIYTRIFNKICIYLYIHIYIYIYIYIYLV